VPIFSPVAGVRDGGARRTGEKEKGRGKSVVRLGVSFPVVFAKRIVPELEGEGGLRGTERNEGKGGRKRE